MREFRDRVIFLVALFATTLILISISLILYFNFKPSLVWETYDFYLFSIFWPPTSCAKKQSGNAECFNEIKNLSLENYFTIHGLWPTYSSGELPKYCTKGNIPLTFNNKTFLDKMNNNWPGIIIDESNYGLWSHEYIRHGYCYIKRNSWNVRDDYIKYFEKSLSIFEKYNLKNIMEEILPDSFGVYNISIYKFQNLLKYNKKLKLNNDSYLLLCDKKTNQLSEIRFFLDLNLKIASNKNKINFNAVCKNEFVLNFTDDKKIPVHKKYDYYAFSLCWNPSSCQNIGKHCYDIIKTKKQKVFSIHGLWPSYKSGIFLQECNLYNDIKINNFEKSLSEKMNNSWYSISNTNEYFWTHEYNKHGFCYMQRINQNTNNYSIYFEKTLELYNKYDFENMFNKDIYSWIFPGMQKLNRTYLTKKLNNKFGENTYGLSCITKNHKSFLSEIRFKFDLDFNLINDAKLIDNCQEEFYLEFLEEYFHNNTQDEHIANDYDMYMFSIFWNPTDCRNRVENYQCYDKISQWKKNIWTVHGLWPNYKQKPVPEWCNGKNDIEINIKNETLLKLMNTYWTSTYHLNEYFWGREYNKHGYCYNKRNNISLDNYDLYFEKTLSIYFKYDLANIFINLYGNLTKGDKDIKRSEIEEYFEKKIGLEKYSYLLICRNLTLESGETYSFITEIRIRFDLDFTLYKNETDKTPYDCPENFKAEFL